MARGGRRTENAQLLNVRSLVKLFEKAFQNDESKNINTSFLKNRIPLHLGGVSDPLSDATSIETSLEVLHVLSRYQYPVVFSTKLPNVLVRDDFLKALEKIKDYLIIQVSFTGCDYRIYEKIEPNIPSYKSRLNSVGFLINEGYTVFIRLQPILPNYTDFVVGEILPTIGELRVKHISMEFLKLPVEKSSSAFSYFLHATGFDYYEHYKKRGAILVGREWILPNRYKWDLLQPLIWEAHRWNISVGCAEYGLYHFSDSNCCCGLDLVPTFSSWFKTNFSYVIKNCRTLNQITFDYIESSLIPEGNVDIILNSNCRNKSCKNLRDYLRIKWNSPGTVNAPDSYLGVVCTYERDSMCNYIYVFSDQRG